MHARAAWIERVLVVGGEFSFELLLVSTTMQGSPVIAKAAIAVKGKETASEVGESSWSSRCGSPDCPCRHPPLEVV